MVESKSMSPKGQSVRCNSDAGALIRQRRPSGRDFGLVEFELSNRTGFDIDISGQVQAPVALRIGHQTMQAIWQ